MVWENKTYFLEQNVHSVVHIQSLMTTGYTKAVTGRKVVWKWLAYIVSPKLNASVILRAAGSWYSFCFQYRRIKPIRILDTYHWNATARERKCDSDGWICWSTFDTSLLTKLRPKETESCLRTRWTLWRLSLLETDFQAKCELQWP